MRKTTLNKWWLTRTAPIIGFDDPTPPAGAAPQAGAEGAQGSGAGDPGTPPAGDPTDDPAAGLKSALQKERTDRKALEKRLAAFEKAEQEKADAEKTEVERLNDQNNRAAEKLTKLATGYRTSAIERAVLEAARAANFRDATDALRPEVLATIVAEQDEDDPSKVTIDSATVKSAVKELLKSKPHYVGVAQQGGTPSGSQFGGKGTVNQGEAQRAALIARYPALQSRFK